ncbi:CHAP domain-containing protein [Saccharopolyspora taberi]|uniref:Peptidase C51 domain-containing protein n=1 Tax=Saccharopolyspora taberi TaxID=60895 RepID=A0ABN3VF29_9PSEU
MNPRTAVIAAAITTVAFLGASGTASAVPPVEPGLAATSQVADEYPELTAAAMAELAAGTDVAAAGRKDIVRIATKEIGYTERANNCNKYSRDCAAWCGMFARWVWQKAGVSKLPPAGYGKAWVATYWAKWGKDKDLLKRRPAGTRGGNPQAGDAIVYGVPGSLDGHVGIVVKVHSDGKLTTIDGNLSDKVVKRTIDPKTKTTNGGAVYGYVRPVF